MKIKFSEVIELGFKKTQGHDSVFEAEYGVPYIITQLEIGCYVFDWYQVTQEVKLLKCKSNGDIIMSIDMENLEMLKHFINLLKPIE